MNSCNGFAIGDSTINIVLVISITIYTVYFVHLLSSEIWVYCVFCPESCLFEIFIDKRLGTEPG